MSNWPSTKSRRVFAALVKIGWRIKRQRGSHIVIEKTGYMDYVWAFHDDEEIGPRMLVRIAKKTGLKSSDL